jgi:hypothetical protein
VLLSRKMKNGCIGWISRLKGRVYLRVYSRRVPSDGVDQDFAVARFPGYHSHFSPGRTLWHQMVTLIACSIGCCKLPECVCYVFFDADAHIPTRLSNILDKPHPRRFRHQTGLIILLSPALSIEQFSDGVCSITHKSNNRVKITIMATLIKGGAVQG